MKESLKKNVVLFIIIVFSVFMALYLYDKYRDYQLNKTIVEEQEKNAEEQSKRFKNNVRAEFKKRTSEGLFVVEITNFNDRTIHGYISIRLLDKNDEELGEESVTIPEDGVEPGDTYRYEVDYDLIENVENANFRKFIY